MFPPYLNASARHVQFASGLTLAADGSRLAITYGEGDCAALEVSVPLQHALAAVCDASLESFARCAAASPLDDDDVPAHDLAYAVE